MRRIAIAVAAFGAAGALAQVTAADAWVRGTVPAQTATGAYVTLRSVQDAKLGPAERMQHVVTIFNRCGAFNKSITFAEQELALDGSGSARLLEVLYFGLSHAYAYDRTNRKAYFGHPGQSGWEWDARADAEAAVAQMLEIHREKSDPVYVAAPAQATDPFANAASR